MRRERVERWRDETQSPWEASPPGLVVWLAWRAVYKGVQPLWLILSLLAAAWFGSQWLASKGGIEAVSDPQPVRAGDLRAALRDRPLEGKSARQSPRHRRDVGCSFGADAGRAEALPRVLEGRGHRA